MSQNSDRLFTRDEVLEIAWRVAKRVALSQGSWTETFERSIEPYYRHWAEKEIAAYLANPRNR